MTMMSKFIKLFAVVLLLASCGKKDDKLSELVFVTSEGPVTYQVETAATKDEMSRGLMERKTLAENSGMIFVLQGQTEIAMWMKDTYIPLDMVFVNNDGKIIWLYENAEPMSTKLIRPQTNEPLSAVIEISGGDIAKNGLKIGDTVQHDALKK